MIPQLAINDLVTGVGETVHPVQGSAVCSKVRGRLKVQSPGAGLATNLELGSAGDAALATALTTGEGVVAMLSILDMAVSSNLPQSIAEASAPANPPLHDTVFPVSANHRNSQTLRSSVRKKPPRGAAVGEQCSEGANHRQFHAALLENCSFFADLVLRQVRGGGDPARDLGRDSSRAKWSVVRVSPTPPKANVLLQPQPEEPALPPEITSSLPTLWVEVGCRRVRTLVSEKERP